MTSNSSSVFSNTVLAGRTVIVTGASRGIGKSIATAMYQAGAKVALVARRALTEDQMSEIGSEASNEHQTKTQITSNLATDTNIANQVHPRCISLSCDVQSDDAVKATVKEVVESFGGIDILVNNAGISRDGLLMRAKDQDWEDTINTNLRGAFLFCRAAAKYLLKAKENGRIINVSSVIGETGNAGQSIYAASKAGLAGFTRSIAKEFASRGVTANTLSPGFIRSDMTKDLIASERGEILLQSIPLRKIGDPSDIADTAVFLASPAGRYITGQILRINGGLFMG